MQILILHAILGKEKICKLTPPHGDEGLVNMSFWCSSGHFMYFLAKSFLSTLTPPNPMRRRSWQKTILCVDLDIGCTVHQNHFSNVATNPHTFGCGFLNLSSVYLWTFNVISTKIILMNFPLPYILEGNPPSLCVGNYRISIKILFRGFGVFLQVVQATICHPRHLL